MASGKYNLNIEQGARFGVQFIWKDKDGNPVDLSGFTGQIQFREEKDSATPLYDSDTNSDITLGPDPGSISFNIDTPSTGGFEFDNAYYDLEMTSGGETERLLEGRVYLSKEVTRA